MLISTPGASRCLSRLSANGLFGPSSSWATWPSLAEYATSTPASGSTRASPWPIERGRARARHLGGEGILPAGIEDDEAELLGALHLGKNPVERHRLVVDMGRGRKLGIDRDEIVHATDLYAVAGVIDERPVEVGRAIAKRLELLGQLRQRQIVLLGHLEAEPPQTRGDGAGVAVGAGVILLGGIGSASTQARLAWPSA